MIKDIPFNFDGIALGELQITFIGQPGTVIEAKLAFVNSALGQTVGWTKQTQFSPRTLNLLEELRQAIEEDAAVRLSGGSTQPRASSGIASNQGKGVTPSSEGIGELLGEGGDGVNQV